MEFPIEQAAELAEKDIESINKAYQGITEEGKMPPRSKIQLRLAVMKRRLALIQKAMQEEQASLDQARKELGLSKKKALPKRKATGRAATK